MRRSIVHWKAPGTSGRICHGRNCYGSVYDRTGCIWKHSPRTHPSCSSGCGPPSLPVWHWDYISPGTWGKTAAGHPGQLDYLPSLQTSMLLLSNVSNGLLIPMRALEVICRYTSVEFGLRCPNNCWINVWLTPSSSA